MKPRPAMWRAVPVEPATRDDEVLAAVLDGLSAVPKRLPSKYFYDARGSALFEQICAQPEYYLTRAELACMRDNLREIAATLGPRVRLVEYGSGSGIKTRLLLEHLEATVAYVPVEISPAALTQSAALLRARFPAIEVLPVCTDFTQSVRLPRAAKAPRRTVVYFPGSTLGNFAAPDALRLLRQMRDEAGQGGGEVGGGALIGVDLVKHPAELEAAYNDAAGVTAAFTLNLLVRLNREIGTNFRIGAFRHRARWNALAQRIETDLVSTREQDVSVGEHAFHFAAGEAMHVEYSCKYTLEGFARLALRAGLKAEKAWTDSAGRFAIVWLLRV